MYKESVAKELECPYKDKLCVVDKCMSWVWFSKFKDVAYENASEITDRRRNELATMGYIELPAHGGGLLLKQFFPMSIDEVAKAKTNAYGNQLLFGLPTENRELWLGHCSCLVASSGE